MSATKIDWSDETVNFFTGCRRGCSYCYARKMARRLAAMPGPGAEAYRRVKQRTGDPFAPAVHLDVMERALDRLTIPKRHGCIGFPRLPRPRRVFVGSMGDLCFEGRAPVFGLGGTYSMDMDTAWLQEKAARFAAALGTDRHTTLWLTKRPDLLVPQVPWPKNAHLGVSVTGNKDAERITELFRRRAAMTCAWDPSVLMWASVEPLRDYDFDPTMLTGLGWVVVGVQTGGTATANMRSRVGIDTHGDGTVDVTRGEALIVAAERIVDWCYDHKVPCFIKDNLRRLKHRNRPPMDWPRELPMKEP